MSPEEFLDLIEGTLLDLTEAGLVEPSAVREDGKLLWKLSEEGERLVRLADERVDNGD